MNRAKFFIAFAFLLASALCVSAQSVQFPNELKGYEFFGNGRLKGLVLTASSKDDVKKIFGADCEKTCVYDADWPIRFEYFDDVWVMTTRDENDKPLKYLLDSRYLGKLRSIILRPNQRQSFAEVSFPATFEKMIITSTMDFESGKSEVTVNDAFSGTNGLTYELHSRTNYDDFKTGQTESANKGDLVLIRYEVGKEQSQTLFVLQK